MQNRLVVALEIAGRVIAVVVVQTNLSGGGHDPQF